MDGQDSYGDRRTFLKPAGRHPVLPGMVDPNGTPIDGDRMLYEEVEIPSGDSSRTLFGPRGPLFQEQ